MRPLSEALSMRLLACPFPVEHATGAGSSTIAAGGKYETGREAGRRTEEVSAYRWQESETRRKDGCGVYYVNLQSVRKAAQGSLREPESSNRGVIGACSENATSCAFHERGGDPWHI